MVSIALLPTIVRPTGNKYKGRGCYGNKYDKERRGSVVICAGTGEEGSGHQTATGESVKL